MREILLELAAKMAPTLGFLALLYLAARFFVKRGYRIWPMAIFWIVVGMILIELALPKIR